jgi:hypothetical protein
MSKAKKGAQSFLEKLSSEKPLDELESLDFCSRLLSDKRFRFNELNHTQQAELVNDEERLRIVFKQYHTKYDAKMYYGAIKAELEEGQVDYLKYKSKKELSTLSDHQKIDLMSIAESTNNTEAVSLLKQKFDLKENQSTGPERFINQSSSSAARDK